MQKRYIFMVVLMVVLGCKNTSKTPEAAAEKDYTQFVNPLIGTDGTGHTFPGPSMPFGLVQPGPDNTNVGWNHTSGYQYQDTALMGFSQTRLNGTGINELGDVLLMPLVKSDNQTAGYRYSKASEQAAVGYYSLVKHDNVKVELTCSERVAFHRYTFPEGAEAQVYLSLQHGLIFGIDENIANGLVLESDVRLENDSTISGYCHTSNWVKRKYFFTVQFDRAFAKSSELPKAEKDKAPRFMLDFGALKNNTLQAKIALSTVSVAGANMNLQTEIVHWNFDAMRQANAAAWNTYLSRIDIEADQKQLEIFYTSLYRLFLQPANIADVDGSYRGADDSIGKAPNNAYYSTLSVWDIYRGAWPLLQLVAPEKVNGIVSSMLLHHQAAGFLPIWTAWGQDNYCMIGNHAIPMILSAYNNGFRGFDAQEALQAMRVTSTEKHINSDWDLYNQYGYYPFDKLDNEAISRTLESGYDDWAVAKMAELLGDSLLQQEFTARSNYYKNVFDPETKLFRGKDTDGKWRNPFDPLTATSPLNNPGDYTEANAWQYFWTPAQYDIAGMKNLLGGDEAFTQQLNTFFTLEAKNPNRFLGQEAMIGQYAHGNEPSHHIAYLYAYSTTPKVGQKYLHQIINEFHNNTPNGMIGNDDCGQMSAWYILTSLGFYPVNPASGAFVFGAPQLQKATLHLANGKQLSIEAENYSATTIYCEKRFLNGEILDSPTITFDQLTAGGTLKYSMEE
jgi:predicted alpha-1,2-mannosidase